MADLIALKAELDGNVPLYGAMTDEEVAEELRAEDKSLPNLVSASEILQAVDDAEYATLTSDLKSDYSLLLNAAVGGAVSADNPNVKAAFARIFAGKTTTLAALNALKTRTGSRAELLGLGRVLTGDVTQARAL